MPSTKKLLPNQDGNSLQPSAPVVAAHSTPTDNVFSEDSAKALLAIILGMSRHMLSPDAQFLSLRAAEGISRRMGVDPAEFLRVQLIAAKYMDAERTKNPLSSMF